MNHEVVRKQKNSRMCFVCGLDNVAGLKASFYEVEGGALVGVFSPSEEHQSYPGRLHGGIAAAMLDETLGRAGLFRDGEEVFGVTTDLGLAYRKPVPLGVPLRVVARITRDEPRVFHGTAELLLPDGTVAVEARGSYRKLPLDKIAGFDPDRERWRVSRGLDEPVGFEF